MTKNLKIIHCNDWHVGRYTECIREMERAMIGEVVRFKETMPAVNGGGGGGGSISSS